ncbi:MAG: hypothetical protein LUD81_02085, partial [Clostridiales bacterium]|nr:hypothetical protein [Clostridiales bacterium]
ICILPLCMICSYGDDEISVIFTLNSPVMSINGTEQAIDEEGTTPVSVNERTLVPVRAVTEAIGGSAAWNNESREVILVYEDNEIILTIDSSTALLNGSEILLDVSPVIINGRTMLPVRFIAESFGYDVEWNRETSQIIISGNTSESEPIEEEVFENYARADNSNILIAYYSLIDIVDENADAVSSATPYSYNTETAAEIIQSKVGGELFKITSEAVYPENHSEASQLAKEQLDGNFRPALTSWIDNIDAYDVIFIGYPIWHQKAPMTVYSFIEEYDFSGKTIIPFCTALGSGISESEKDLREMCPNAKFEEGLSLSTEDSTMADDIEEWLSDINISGSQQSNSSISDSGTPVVLTIGSETFNATLNDTKAAKDLISRLPVTVELNDSDNDFCGGIEPPIEYDESEVQYGYKNGDLAFWTAGDDFVIFIDDEELSENTGDLVILGRITDNSEELKNLNGTISVEISLK